MLKNIAFYLIVALSLAGGLTATTYHVTKVGNDADDGTSWTLAWATVEHVNDNITAGDTVLFGTGIWYNSQIVPPVGGTYDKRTVYSCSTVTPETKHLARIYSGDSVRYWTRYSGNIWSASWTGTGCWNGPRSYCLVQDDSLMLDPVNASSGEDQDDIQEGQFYHTGDVMYAWLYNDALPNEHEMLSSCRPAVYLTTDRGHCLFYGLDLRFGKQGVVLWAGWNSNHADSCFFEHCHIRYGSGQYGENASCIMSRFTGDDTTQYGHWNTFYACSIGVAEGEGPTLYYHNGSGCIMYSQHYMYFDSCYFYDLPDVAVLFKHRGTGTAGWNVVRYCTMEEMGAIGVYLGSHCYEDSVYGNIIIRPGIAGVYFRTYIDNDDPGPINCFVGNNTIYNPISGAANTGLFMWFMNWNVGSGNKIMYNVGYHGAGDEDHDIGFYGDGEESAFLIDSNIWHATHRAFSGECNDSWKDFDGWQNDCGFDIHGSDSDPGLDDPVNGSYSRPNTAGEMDLTYGGRTWTVFGAVQTADCGFICGDVNWDCVINLLDIVFLITYLYRDGPAPERLEAADVDSSGNVNLLDVTYLIDYIYKGGPEPVCPQGKKSRSRAWKL